jgi:NADH-quinone oxidoreductase subunit H
MGPLSTTAFLISAVAKVLVIFVGWLIVVAGVTLAERKIAAWIQDRSGPNRVGPWGILQPIADGIKNFVKEEHIPGGASRWLFFLAPIIAMFPAFVIIAVIPVAAPLPTPWGLVEVIVADLPIGFLFVLALGSLGVYGLTLGGWASNSKYSFLGGVRASAQMISYEVALGLSLVPIFMLSGNVTLPEIIRQQQDALWYTPRRTVARSTCRRPSRSWSTGSTPNTPPCGWRCSTWRSTPTWSPLPPSWRPSSSAVGTSPSGPATMSASPPMARSSVRHLPGGSRC